MIEGAPPIIVQATKPTSQLAERLRDIGLTVLPVEQGEGNVDRYILSSQLAVERRTGATFLRGIQDKSLFTSAIYLREHFATPILIIEGEVNYEYSAFNPQAVRGALSAMMLEYGLSVVSTPDLDETAQLLALMARQAQVGVPEISLVPKRKAVDLPDLQRRVVEMLPGCGRVTARDLLHHFGTIERILNATRRELCQVRGIGETRAAEIHQVLHAEYAAVDTERNLEDAIEADAALLFEDPVELLARQHVIPLAADERHVVDLVYFDPAACQLILVELKRSPLTIQHEAQLRRYLDDIHRSPMLMDYVNRGATLQGLLVTVTSCDYTSASPDIDVAVVEEARVIEVLRRLRRERWSEQEGR